MLRWSNEDLFIYEMIKCLFGGGDTELLHKLLAGRGWGSIADRAAQLEMGAFFYDAVKSGKAPLELPPEVLKRWKYEANRNALLNMMYEEEGGKIVRELNERGIVCVLLKGLAFMEQVYGNKWVRPVGDLDILISREEYPLVRDHLLNNEFVFCNSDIFRGTGQEYVEVCESFANEMSFVRHTENFTFHLDVHWDVGGLREGSHIKQLYPLHSYPWREGLEPFQFGGASAVRLSLEMQFIHLVCHFALNHQFRGVKWFVDLVQFIERFGEQMDWRWINGIVTDANVKKVFGITLKLVSGVTGGAGCAAEKSEVFMAGNTMTAEYNFYRRHLFSSRSHTGTYLCHVLMPCRLKDKLKVLSYLLFDNTALPHWRISGKKGLPPALQPFYLVYRAAEEGFAKILKRSN